MTPTTRTPNVPATSIPAPECGPDCVYIDGTCRCYHGEPTTTQFTSLELNRVVPPF